MPEQESERLLGMGKDGTTAATFGYDLAPEVLGRINSIIKVSFSKMLSVGTTPRKPSVGFLNHKTPEECLDHHCVSSKSPFTAEFEGLTILECVCDCKWIENNCWIMRGKTVRV